VPIAEVNDQRLFYTDSGGPGTAIVFTHGFLMDGEMFAPQVEEFGDEYRVITWDCRGFGRTEASDDPFTVWDQARDLIGLMEQLGVDSAVLAGMSHGGYISMRVPLLEPGRARALILLDTSASGLTEQEKVGYRGMFDQWIDSGPTEELAGPLADLIIGDPALHRKWIDKWRSWPKERLRQPALATVEVEDIRCRLKDIHCPALVVHGEDDRSFPVALAEQIVEHLPGAGSVSLVPGGHAASLTHAHDVNDRIRAFLAAL